MRVLFLENDKVRVRSLKRKLTSEGFAVDVAAGSEEAARKTGETNYDVIILDIAVPGEDSVSLLARWRREGLQAQVLVLGDQGGTAEKVHCLDSGADDYLAKPFEIAELLARVRALFRRRHQLKTPVLRIHDLEIDTASRSVKRAGRSIYLTPREYELLQLLAFHRGKLVTRTMIKEHLYEEKDQRDSNVVDVYIRYLRNKIDKHFDFPLIITQWGRGYLLRNDEL